MTVTPRSRCGVVGENGRFRMPELPTGSGVTLLSAEEVTVAGRLDQPVTVALGAGARLEHRLLLTYVTYK